MKSSFFFLAVFLLSCFAFADLGPLPKLSPAELNARRQVFNYEADYFVKGRGSYVIDAAVEIKKMKLTYTNHLGGSTRVLNFDIYRDRLLKNNILPLIVLFPPLRGISKFDRDFAKYFAKQGYQAVVSHVSKDIEDFSDIETLMKEFVDATVDNRVLLDYLQTLPFVNKGQINLLGISLGAIRGSIFYGVEPRIKAGALIVGGGNLPGIMSLSVVKGVRALRDSVSQAYGLQTPAEFEAYVRTKILWDPIYSAQLRNGEDLFMAIGMTDDRVGAQFQNELATAYNCKNVRRYKMGHIQTAAAVYLKKKIVRDFFENRH